MSKDSYLCHIKWVRPCTARSGNIKFINMIQAKKAITVFTMITAAILLLAGSGCKKDNPAPTPARTATYNLKVKDVLGITGKVTFTETSSTTTTVVITLTGPVTGGHPAQLVANSAVEQGAIAVTLTPVDATGKSSTVVSMSYTDLIAYDGHINVIKSVTEPGVILAQGDIGGNLLTGINKSYALTDAGSFGVTGTALFEKRVNGNTLITISLNGTISNNVYPASINLGSIESVGGGPVKRSLNDVNGTTGKSYTNIRKLDDGITAVTYDNWLVYDGYLNIYQSSVSYSTIICHGNIGSN